MYSKGEWLELEAHWAARQRGDADRCEWSEKLSKRLMQLRRVFGYSYGSQGYTR